MARNTPPDGQGHMLFVYGTLKRDFANHYFLRKTVYVGRARTVNSYALYVDEFPLVYPGEAVSPIRGELYKVDDATLQRIDALRGHPDIHQRERVPVRQTGVAEDIEAWIYFFPEPAGRLVVSGEFDTTTGLAPERDRR